MLKSIKAINSAGIETMLYPATDWVVKEFDGIDPGEAELSLSDYASMDGAYENGIRMSAKYPTMQIVITGPDIERKRHELYKAIPIKDHVRFVVETGERSWYIDTIIDKCNVNIFSSKPGSQTISFEMPAPDPHMYAEQEQITDLNTITALFEFPVTFTTEGFYFSSVSDETTGIVAYDGDEPTGVVITLKCTGDVSGFKVYNTTSHGSIEIDDAKLKAAIGSTLQSGDIVEISTVKGDKHLKLFRDGTDYNILRAINASPEWFELSPGDNLFEYAADSGVRNCHLSITNRVAYTGV